VLVVAVCGVWVRCFVGSFEVPHCWFGFGRADGEGGWCIVMSEEKGSPVEKV
jgi:hypothetical protein